MQDADGVLPLEASGEIVTVAGMVGRAFRIDHGQLAANNPYGALDAITWFEGTLQFWLKPSQQSGGEVTTFLTHQEMIWQLALDPGLRPRLNQTGAAGVVAASSLVEGRWHHIALVSRNDLFTVYVDGSSVMEVQRVRGSTEGARTLRFGPLPGLIDEIAMYERALNAAEVREIASSTPGCVAPRSGE